MKISGNIWIETTFKCKLCGKKFNGEINKTYRKFLRHLIFKHPICTAKRIKNILTNEEENKNER